MQASLTLALVNPFLWYLIDRSKPGFLLSSAVGLAGSAILMGLNPAAMPSPATSSSSSSPPGVPSSAAAGGTAQNHGVGNFNASTGGTGGATSSAAPGWLAHSQETVETGIWIVSVLFCSCVCFGNIGRRLALNRSAVARGRWAGVR